MVLALSELDLEASLLGPRSRREDRQDEFAPIEDAHAEGLLEVAPLDGRQLDVADGDAGVDFFEERSELLGLALAEIVRRSRVFARLVQGRDGLDAGGAAETSEFVEALFDVIVTARRYEEEHRASVVVLAEGEGRFIDLSLVLNFVVFAFEIEVVILGFAVLLLAHAFGPSGLSMMTWRSHASLAAGWSERKCVPRLSTRVRAAIATSRPTSNMLARSR